jgi:hypothetical protein
VREGGEKEGGKKRKREVGRGGDRERIQLFLRSPFQL